MLTWIGVGGVLTWGTASTIFGDAPSNGERIVSPAIVSLSDDHSASSLFSVAGLKPGSTGMKCVMVTFTGTMASKVKLYTTASSYRGALGSYVDLTVDEGSGSFAGGCDGFRPAGRVYSGTVSAFNAVKTSFATGVGSWAPTVNGQTKMYRFGYTIRDKNQAQGLSGGISFTWEAQNR